MAEIVDGDLRDDGDRVSAGFTGGQDGLAQLVEIAEGFEYQEIGAGFDQSFGLLAENAARLGEGCGAERFNAHSQRSDGAGHKGAFAGCFAGNAYAGLVDGLQLLRYPEG